MANDGKFLTIETGRQKQELAIQTSAGAADANKLARLDASGRWDSSLMPIGLVPDVKSVLASENISAGAPVNVYNNAGTLNVRKADATASGKEANGYIITTVTAGNTVSVYFEAINNQLSGLTPGSRYYLATTAGTVTATAPTGSGNVVQYLGVALSTTELQWEPEEGTILA